MTWSTDLYYPDLWSGNFFNRERAFHKNKNLWSRACTSINASYYKWSNAVVMSLPGLNHSDAKILMIVNPQQGLFVPDDQIFYNGTDVVDWWPIGISGSETTMKITE